MPVAVNHYDKVAMAAGRKVDELLLQTPESLVGRKVTSAIVMLDRETGVYRVVSVGSGNQKLVNIYFNFFQVAYV
jgi:hypothetical protein